MYGRRWMQGGDSLVESRLLRVVLDQTAARARHRFRTPVTVVPEETSFRDLTTAQAPTVLGRLIEDGAALLDVAVAAHRASGRAAAKQLRALAAFARHRPAGSFDRAPGEPGAASPASRAVRPEVLTTVSEWAADEVATRLQLTGSAAQDLLVLAVTLDEQLPATLTAWEEGRIGRKHAEVLAELLPLLTHPAARAEVEARLLARVGSKTPSQLRVATRRAVLRADANAALRRAAAAVRERGVRLYPGRDGTDTLSLAHAGPVARACYDALERYAEACRTERDTRTKQQRMADCLADLILRPGENGLPPVQAQLTITAAATTLLGGDEPGEVDGEPLPAEVIREIAYALGLLPRPTSVTADAADSTISSDETGPGPVAAAGHADPRWDGPTDAPSSDRAAADPEDTPAELADLLLTRRITGTTLAARPQIAVTHPLTGALLALTDATAIRRGDPIGRPGQTLAYRADVRIDRFVRARDRRCRFPGCRARPRRCDLDHRVPYDRGGPTSPCNLCCLCEHHHRLKTLAPGWAMAPMPDGGIRWTVPGGHQVTTHPPAYGTDDDQPPDPPATASAGSTSHADDPPPF
ncbi:DUF222 domain-containing protein [Geodermatophilus sp. SYSU D01176]